MRSTSYLIRKIIITQNKQEPSYIPKKTEEKDRLHAAMQQRSKKIPLIYAALTVLPVDIYSSYIH